MCLPSACIEVLIQYVAVVLSVSSVCVYAGLLVSS
jgi:hypothetical protein